MPHTFLTDTDLPPEVRDRSAWYGVELTKRDDWVERLSEAEIDEVESAVQKLGRLPRVTEEGWWFQEPGPQYRLSAAKVRISRR